ncbi:DNA polymerase III subunit alpha [[Acholeplasma] multilocale]|uniref:DNA polymerase III subunit alpha n=1 Tax=[Acholeplasma] multilocale TaxID=264638 RepID=UPI00047C2CB2|nr:DNA polymerase III subunit alpha [[Acholeplasma] multilocale]
MSYSPQFNVRSAYNFQESFIKIDDYISFAKANNFDVLFYSENKTMFGVAEFIKKAKAANIKPIIGLSIELKQGIINLYPKNQIGFKTINHLSSWMMNGVDHDEDEIIAEVIKLVDNNLIILTNFEVEISDVEVINVSEQGIFFDRICYFKASDYTDYVILNAIKNNLLESEIGQVKQANYPQDENLENFEKHQELVDKISQDIKFELFENNQRHLIEFVTPHGIPSYNFLEKLCFESLEKYFQNVKRKNVPDNYVERLNYELSVIKAMKFEDYFLVVWDYVKYAKDQGILVGPGRGSAAGSLVAFLLRITEVDPIEYNLLFERFLNPERVTMPDIDIDFQDDRREEVIEYLFEKYGVFNVSTIVTYQSIGVKSAIRDVARVYGIEMDIVNAITRNINFENLNDFEGAINASPKLKEYSEQYEEIFIVAKKLVGLPRQTGTHAAGVVLSDDDLRDVLPIKVGYNGIYQTQFDMNHLEELGLIKMDLLGLRNLTTLQEIRKAIYRTRKINVSLNKIPLDDKRTYETLRRGDTSGIFQLESRGMTNVVRRMKVNSIEDISAASALYRPGPQEFIPEYIERKNSYSKKHLIDPALADILNPTYGIIVYQEQVIQILQSVANFTLAKADIVRRAMGKKNHEYMDSVQKEFIQGALANGYSQAKAVEIWTWIDKFASYGFNKSHSIAYSYISYWLAYFKTNFTEEFYCSLLNGVLGNGVKTSQYLKEIAQYGVKVKIPSVKNVNYGYIGTKGNVFMPLTLIKGIGQEFISKLRILYEEDKTAFENIFAFVTRMSKNGLNKNTFMSLAKAGAFNSFGYNRQTLIDNIDLIMSFAEFNQNVEKLDPLMFPLIEESVLDDEIVAEYEKEIFGFYLTGHPLTKVKIENSTLRPTDIIKAKHNLGNLLLIGVIDSIRVKKDKTGKEMAFMTLIDDTDEIDITVFSRTFENVKYDIQIGSILALDVRTDQYNGKVNGTLNKITKIIRK